MEKYEVIVSDNTFLSLKKILSHKIEFSQTASGAIKFRNKIFTAIENLFRL